MVGANVGFDLDLELSLYELCIILVGPVLKPPSHYSARISKGFTGKILAIE
jgi:hypothetical protein